eukprot:12787447-Alexandrium_andersonii.AAC.1
MGATNNAGSAALSGPAPPGTTDPAGLATAAGPPAQGGAGRIQDPTGGNQRNVAPGGPDPAGK